MIKSLRTFIVISAIVVACSAVTSEQKEKAAEHVKTCVTKIGVSEDDITRVIGGDFSKKDTKIECFAKCFFEESGFMNAEGDFLDEVAIEKLSVDADKTKVEALVNTCKLKMGENACETAFEIYKCYITRKAF